MNDRLPEGWNLKKISDIGKVIGGGTPSTKEDMYYGGDIPWLTPKDLSNYNHMFIDKGERNITKLGLKNSSARLMPKGTVLFSSRAPIGYVAIAKNNVSTNQGFKSIICNKNVADNKFIYYTLKYYKETIENIAVGSTFREVSGKVLKEFKILLPPLNEQKEIANILSTIDDKIELNNQMNQTLEAIGQAIFRYWFVHFEFPDENGQPYKSSGGKMMDSELGEIPAGWEVVENIAEKCDLINYGYTQSATEEEVGPKFLRVMDINKGDWINWETVPYCEIDQNQLPKYILKKGDIVIARMADPGKVAIFESDIEAVFASYLIRIRFMDPRYSYYFYYLMKSPYYQFYIVGASSGTVQSNLNAKGLTRGLPVLIPNEMIVNDFNKTIELLRVKINTNIQENQYLSQIRDSLLPKLMSGKIRVSMEATAK